jgi:hypothetical protein
MRALLLVGVGLAGATASLSAQRSDQIELGVYGSFTRFDRAYQLPDRVGGGVRFGYFLSDRVSIEVDGTYLGPSAIAGRASYFLHTGHASLVFNFPLGSSSFYVLGGASRVDLGTTAPYNFAENGIHGGAGLRFLLGDRLGLRLDGKAFYRPPKSPLTGLWTGHVIGSAGISYVTGMPRRGGYYARSGDRNHQWYWGAQGGLFIYKTNVQSSTAEPIFGGHWLITSRRTAFYFGIEQSFFLSDAQAVIFDPNSSSSSAGPGFRDVTFSKVRRVMFGLVTHPAQRRMEPFVGGGFAMVQILSPAVDCSSCTNLSELAEAQDRAAEAASKAFFWLKGGLQINYSSKLNVFANYLITSSSQGFLLDGNTHTLQGGIRYSLGTSKEGITERN